MNKDQVKGAVKKTEGRVQKAAGDLTGSTKQQLKGTLKELEGSAQEAVGNAKDKVKKASK